ncbi:unnamed protein product [Meganyctiphanes norvegica]|uniref:Uncharacterized protein n=1 Tax=Meganyctiphanes norvegica TaxID=48144 RepID=A0AAV2QMR0_MEGNR
MGLSTTPVLTWSLDYYSLGFPCTLSMWLGLLFYFSLPAMALHLLYPCPCRQGLLCPHWPVSMFLWLHGLSMRLESLRLPDFCDTWLLVLVNFLYHIIRLAACSSA